MLLCTPSFRSSKKLSPVLKWCVARTQATHRCLHLSTVKLPPSVFQKCAGFPRGRLTYAMLPLDCCCCCCCCCSAECGRSIRRGISTFTRPLGKSGISGISDSAFWAQLLAARVGPDLARTPAQISAAHLPNSPYVYMNPTMGGPSMLSFEQQYPKQANGVATDNHIVIITDSNSTTTNININIISNHHHHIIIIIIIPVAAGSHNSSSRQCRHLRSNANNNNSNKFDINTVLLSNLGHYWGTQPASRRPPSSTSCCMQTPSRGAQGL